MTSGLHGHGHQISQPAHHLESTVLPAKEKTVHGKEKTFKVAIITQKPRRYYYILFHFAKKYSKALRLYTYSVPESIKHFLMTFPYKNFLQDTVKIISQCTLSHNIQCKTCLLCQILLQEHLLSHPSILILGHKIVFIDYCIP